MRKIVMFNRVTLDGFFAGTHDEIDWFVQDPEVDKTLHDKMNPDTVLFGGRTFEMFEDFWPHVAMDPNAHPGQKMMADELTNMTKIVFSKSLKNTDWANTEIHHDNLIEEIKKLKKGDGADIVIFGSGTIVQQLAEQGLIDEYFFVVTLVVLGAGKLLFDGVKRSGMKLLDTKSFNSGNVLLHYKKA
ncbi:MAG TPA: dihydrofolate reductase family protein [Candidatus Saccharimonadales bacterium]|nr:dihydrofolate reductase family protein [Candidatus Saccharimonadales bacterium]